MPSLKPTDPPLVETEAERSLEGVVKMQRNYRHSLYELCSVATQDELAQVYREALHQYDWLCATRRAALGYAVSVSEHPNHHVKDVAASLARRTLRYTGHGQVPHPNEYLSEEQRAVLVLLDTLEPLEEHFDASAELVERARVLCRVEDI